MRPKAAANQITKALRAALPPERWFPVDPLVVAREFGIQVHEEDLGKGMEGALLSVGKNSAIVINSLIREPGRRAFTAAHELGHYSLHRDRPELRCSVEDLLDTAPHPANIEQDANEFAMTLLMPIDDFRVQAGQGVPSMQMVKQLAARYGTSLTSTALRLRESSSKAFAVVWVVSGKVKWWWPTRRFRWQMRRGQAWPLVMPPTDEAARYSTEPVFGVEARARLGEVLRVSGVEMHHYDASLWIVDTPDERRPWEWDVVER